MNNLFLLCGKVGSGKTTLAKNICQNFDAVLFSADDFMLKLFGEIEDQKTFNEKLTLCKELIYDTCEKISKKTNVVLDFGFWTKEERANPELVDKSSRRRERIARGSGRSVAEVNKLRQMLDQQRRMARQMSQIDEEKAARIASQVESGNYAGLKSTMGQPQPYVHKGKGKNKNRFRF